MRPNSSRSSRAFGVLEGAVAAAAAFGEERRSVSVAGARTVSPGDAAVDAACTPTWAVVMVATIARSAPAEMPSDQTRKP